MNKGGPKIILFANKAQFLPELPSNYSAHQRPFLNQFVDLDISCVTENFKKQNASSARRKNSGNSRVISSSCSDERTA